MNLFSKFSKVSVVAAIVVVFTLATVTTVFATTQLPAPTNLSSSCGHTTSAFSWAPVSGATRYAVRIDDLSNPWGGVGDVLENNVTASHYTIPSVPGKSYVWWVHAVDSFGRFSPGVGAFCMTPQVSAPTNLSVRCSEGPQVTFSWNGVPGGTRYAIRIIDLSLPWTQGYVPAPITNDAITGTSYTFTPRASVNSKYTWWIHAVGANGVYSTQAVGKQFSLPLCIRGII